jgi:hypothetical protein
MATITFVWQVRRISRLITIYLYEVFSENTSCGNKRSKYDNSGYRDYFDISRIKYIIAVITTINIEMFLTFLAVMIIVERAPRQLHFLQRYIL